MTGGEIVRCSAGYYGGGVCINNAYKKTFSATACLEGGSIVGCSADIYGGGLANLYAKATVNGTAIHSNTAASAGDDIVSFARPTGELSISSVGDSWELDDCDHPIDGWYDDGTGSYRWNVHDDKQPLYTEKVESGKYTTTIALKAAHGSGHTVTFDTQGGSAVDSQTVFSGTAVEPDVPTKTDYVFGGWYKDSLCTEAYDFSAPVTNSITLYARWLSASPHYILRYGDGRPEDGGDPYTFPYDPANPASLPTEVRYFSQEEIDQLSTGIYQGVTTEGNYFLAWFGYMPTLESTINTNYPVYEKTAVDTYTEFTGMPIPGKTYYQFIPCETTPDTNLGDIIYYAQWVKVKIDIAVNVQVDVDVSFDENLGGNVVMIADSQKQELAKNFKASDIVSNNCAITLTATVANPRNTAEEETTAEFLTQNYPNCRSISYDVEIRKDIESNGSWYSTVILKELEAPVEITFAVPEEWKSGTVKMLRAHTEGGAVTVDECVDLDQDRQTFTLSRDKFSTYTMLYIPAGGGGGGGIETACTLRYQSNGGTGYPDETRINPWIKNYADLPVPVREGYSFTGWYADSTLQTPITGDVLVNRNLVTIYAGWKKSTVPEMLNGAEHFAYVQGYTDGTVRPNENITRAEVATIFFRLLKDEIRDEYLTDTNTFADVTEGMWYNKAVSTMVALDVFKGRTPERFDPRAPITRGEFAAICSRFDRSEVIPRSVFTDIDGYWAKEEIERAAALGWVGGYGDGSYRPRDYISRAQVMTIINRMLLRNPESEENLLPGMKTWSDNKPGSWCYLAVQEATNSHEFRRKVNGYESWTVLKANPDWSIYQ
ncbi:MAG: S-layer homology domain-containing protein [Oscillospiraceae bacterium]